MPGNAYHGLAGMDMNFSLTFPWVENSIDPRRAGLLPVGTIYQRALNMTDQTAPQISDAEQVARAKAGDLDAFEALTTRYEQRVYSVALRMLRHEQDAEDVTQQTFLSALENLNGFRGDASFATWLLRIATHAALKVIRKQKGLDTVSLEEATEEADDYATIPHPEYIADWRQSPATLVPKNEIQRLLEDALAKLDEKHRPVFLLRDVEGLSVKETAAALGLSEANTKVRLLRARLQLREQLTRTLGDPARQVMRVPHDH
jgi:RNA polymerase sigma-70 factor (ECF subfamily)